MNIREAYQPIVAKLEGLAARQAEVEAQINLPETAEHPARMTELAKEHGRLSRTLASFRTFQKSAKTYDESLALANDPTQDQELRDLAAAELPELLAARDAILESIVTDFLSADELAVESLILEIRAGTGGEEAALFARDLTEMYRRYCEKRHWKFEMMDFSPSDMGGFRDIVINVKGDGAYRALAFEGGGHRVQRVPETESQGRVHTSAATVAVLPEADESAIVINPAEVREDVSRAGGPGGQGVNKVESAVQLTHLPTGITVRMRDERSQHKNRDKAWRILRTRIFEHFDSARRAERSSARKEMIGSGDRNARIRTYSFPQNRLTDHRINENFPLEKVIAGDMDDLLTKLAQYDREQRLAAISP